MLLPEQVIPFLSSDDPLLRDQATRYFSDYARSPFPLTAEQCWDAINQIGLRSKAYALIGLLPLASQNDGTTGQLLAALDAPGDALTRGALLDALADIDFEQLTRHRDAIFARSDIPDEIRARLQNRLDLAELSVGALWRQLEQHAINHKDRYWNETDHSIEAALIEALARHGQPAIERALAVIHDTSGGVLEICAIDLLAAVRYRPALEALVKKFIEADEGDDLLYETMERALPRIGGLDLIPAIEAIFFEQTGHFELYVADAIASLRHPDAEAALMRLYDSEKNEQSHANLALALLNLCPTDALPILVELFRAGFGDKYLKGDFEQALVACSLMAGFEFEELPLLREVLVNRAAVDRLRREAAALKGIPLDQLDDDLYEEDFQDQYDDESFIDPLPPPSGTIRNVHPKIGRNDPCPCGSGKKYKKCCLDRERA